jgi:hypothetical protein
MLENVGNKIRFAPRVGVLLKPDELGCPPHLHHDTIL